VYIQDVTEEYVSSAQEAMKIFKKGVSNRVVAFTSMNDVSSRSHMAFILTLHQSNLKDGSAKSAKMTVIDLAGS
jgi:kinesin family protein 5